MPKRPLNPGMNGRHKEDPRKQQAQIETLGRALDGMFARQDGKPPRASAEIKPLLQIAASLRELPREDFKARLKVELREGRRTMPVAETPAVETIVTPRSTRTSAMAHLSMKDAARAIKFYEKALGAEETFRFEAGGRIAHAEIKIGDTKFGISDEWPEGGRLSAETRGYSPVTFRVFVSDVDSFAARAVEAGMKVAAPIVDQFYGYREGSFMDPFGYTWNLVTVKEEMSLDEMHRRLDRMMPNSAESARPAAIRPGFRTVTPYLVAQNAESVIEFVKKVFGGEETFRDVGSAGGYHCEVRVDDTMMMIGGGAPNLKWKGDSVPGAFHVYVRDCDAAYQRALDLGAKSLQPPTDEPWGERRANVVDTEGNFWYICTFLETGYKWADAPTVQPYMHPLRAEPVIQFLKNAFQAEDLGRHTTPDGVIHHVTLKIGTSQIEMTEAMGPYQPMKSMYYLYVPNCDAVYRAAITAGASSIHEPADQPYGDRVGAVQDIFGNQWYIGTHKTATK